MSGKWYVPAWEGNFQRWNNPIVRERARKSLERVLLAKRAAAVPSREEEKTP